MRISDWSSDVCSSDLAEARRVGRGRASGVRRARANLSIEGRRDGGTQAMARRDRGVVVAPARELQGACRGRPVSGAAVLVAQIGRASGRERVCQYCVISVVAVTLKKKQKKKKKRV